MAKGPDRQPFGSRLLGSADQSLRQLRRRVQWLLTLLLVATNVIGAGIVYILSNLVIPGPTANHGTTVSMAIAVPTYVAVAVIVGAAVGTRQTVRALRWSFTDGTPTDRERIRTLRAARNLTIMQAGLWGAATFMFTLLAIIIQPGRAVTTGLTVGIASVVVVTIAFLLSEFALRPVAARALIGAGLTQRHGMGVSARLLVFWWLGTGAPVLGLVVVAILSLSSDSFGLTKLAVVVMVLGGVVILFGFFVMWLSARAVVAPVMGVARALRQVEDGRFGTEVQVFDGSELGLLQAGFNRMSQGLAEREQLRDAFGRQVGRDVAAAALGDVSLGGETRQLSVLFVDIVGSTAFAAEREPAEVVAMLNGFFAVIIDEVDKHHGLVNKFMGDAVLAIFGAPTELEDHAGHALAAARGIAARLADAVGEVRAGVGVATGAAVAGYVGHESRFEYTVIGDAVNAASRLTDLAKGVDSGLMADRASIDAAQGSESSLWEPYDETVLRGRSEPTQTFVLRST